MKQPKGRLAYLQAMSLQEKIRRTQNLIYEWLSEYPDAVVSFSGGKDSLVLLTIARTVEKNIGSVFFNTGVEFPYMAKFAEDNGVKVIQPKDSFLDIVHNVGVPLISKEVAQLSTAKEGTEMYDRLTGQGNYAPHGYRRAFNLEKYKWVLNAPFKLTATCCDKLKKKPAKQFDNMIVGTRADESMLRTQAWYRTGCNAYEKHKSTPIAFWREQDVLEYLFRNHIPLAKPYGDIVYATVSYRCTGCQRTGCMWCLFGAHLEDEEHSRILWLKRNIPSAYDFMMRDDKQGLGYRKILEWVNENTNLHIYY